MLRKRKEDELKKEAQSEGNVATIAFGRPISTAEVLSKSTPVRSHRLFNRPRKGVFKVHEISNDLREVADESSTGDFGLRSLDFNAKTVSAIDRSCPWTPVPDCSHSSHKSYRSADGSCNSLAKPNYGKSTTPFQRILPPAYTGIFIHTEMCCKTMFFS